MLIHLSGSRIRRSKHQRAKTGVTSACSHLLILLPRPSILFAFQLHFSPVPSFVCLRFLIKRAVRVSLSRLAGHVRAGMRLFAL